MSERKPLMVRMDEYGMVTPFGFVCEQVASGHCDSEFRCIIRDLMSAGF